MAAFVVVVEGQRVVMTWAPQKPPHSQPVVGVTMVVVVVASVLVVVVVAAAAVAWEGVEEASWKMEVVGASCSKDDRRD